jgi:hypothetical protein
MMLIAAELPKNKGMVVFLVSTIGGCMTNASNPKETDVYTDNFPEGVTVDVEIDRFAEMWQTALSVGEIEIEIEDDTEGSGTCH